MAINKKLIIIGDRVLVSLDRNKDRTETGLYLPQGLAEKEKIQSGYVIKTGPGYIIPSLESGEPWTGSANEPQYVPLQVKTGDYALFLRKESIEIEYDKKKYLIVPQAGILAVVRDDILLDRE